MDDRARKIIEVKGQLKTERNALDSLFEEIAEVLAPERVGFVSGTPTSNQRSSNVFDTTPMIAKRGLVNALGAMLRPKSSAAGKWFDIVPEDQKLLEKREIKDWVDFAEERLWRALYNPTAHFIQATGECDDDLVTFGTSVGYTGVRPDQSGLMFRSFHLGCCYIEVDAMGSPVGIYVCERLTAKQAVSKWGEDNLGEKTKEALRSGQQRVAEKFDFIWWVGERHERDHRVKNNKNMPFASIVVDVGSEHIVTEEGYEEFPFFIPRWDTRSGEVYGRGPGVLALPDVLTLNSMGKTMLRGLHRAVDPSWLFPSDSMVTAPALKPGGVSYYDAKAIKNIGLGNPFIQMESRGNIPWGLNAQTALRESILAMFYRNILNLPVDAPQMTATEVIQRREEFVREIGAVFGRLESDYTGPMVERAFNILMRKGAFGPVEQIPEELQGANISFRFASPVEKAKRQIEEATVMQGVAKVLEIGQVQPKIMNRFNWDAIGKFVAESNDFPSQLTLDDKEVEEINQAAAQQQQQAQELDTLERASNMARNVAPLAASQQAATGVG